MRALFAAVVLAALLLIPLAPPGIGCHRVGGHHHGHGKPAVVCLGG